jgi:hypothetical protein
MRREIMWGVSLREVGTDEELDEMFGQYEPASAPKPKLSLLDKLLAPSDAVVR